MEALKAGKAAKPLQIHRFALSVTLSRFSFVEAASLSDVCLGSYHLFISKQNRTETEVNKKNTDMKLIISFNSTMVLTCTLMFTSTTVNRYFE